MNKGVSTKVNKLVGWLAFYKFSFLVGWLAGLIIGEKVSSFVSERISE